MLIRNTAFQFVGKGSALAFGLLSVPVFLFYLGNEVYGVIGVYIALMSLSGLLDLGLPVLVNREISILRSNKTPLDEISKTIRSLEVIVIVLSLCVFAAIFFLSSFIASSWLNLIALNADQVETALQYAALAIALRFPTAFYNNCLYAFELHGRSAMIAALFAGLRLLVPVLIFQFYAPSMVLFFMSQVLVNGLEIVVLWILTWWRTGLNVKSPMLAFQAILKHFPLTIGLTGLSITALLLSQLDKAILTKLIALDEFGLYAVAMSLAMGILPVAYSIGNASFPSLNRLIAQNETDEIEQYVQRILNLKMILLCPFMVFFVFYESTVAEILRHFSKDSEAIAQFLSVLGIGAFIQCYSVLFHGFRLAQGDAFGLLKINLIALPLFMGTFLYGANQFGAMAVAYGFIGLNAFILLGQIFLSFSHQEMKSLWLPVIKKAITALLLSIGGYYFYFKVFELIELNNLILELLYFGITALILMTLQVYLVKRMGTVHAIFN